jgi:tetratricopeptide (TPR) repeat protein
MKETKIDLLAYILKEAKKKNLPKPIFFLGAGASRSGNIPLAGEIIKQILHDYSDYPPIKDLPIEGRTYAKLMDCLQPDQRDELLKKYIDEAKINVAHIYLAQLIKEGFVDYVLTVNFDNLMLRSLALFNIFPATYDMAILQDFTTTTFKEKSVVYLHVQSHGLWLLNTSEEMKKVKGTVPRIFDTIKNKRPWVFIGYSGEDPIFEYVKNLGRFNNGLYWVTYNDYNPIESVQKFLSEPNTNAYIIKGYDADSFMLKLNSELELAQPYIVDKPFSALKEMLTEIVDIDDKEHFEGVKERLNISIRQVDEAIQQFELGEIESFHNIEENKIDLLKKEIINLIISEQYDEKTITDIEVKVKGISNHNLQSLLSGLYSDWGIFLGSLAQTKEGKEADELYRQSFEKYQKAIEIKPDNHNAYNNLASYLVNLAKTKKGKEAKYLYFESFTKYQKAIEIKPDKYESYKNWGNALVSLAKTKKGKEAEDLYYESFSKYQKAIEIKSDEYDAYHNWGIALVHLAKTLKVKEAEDLYHDSFSKFQKAIEIKPDKHEAYNNWGNALVNLAKTKQGKEAEDLYYESFSKYQKAIEIKPDNHQAFYNWGNALVNLAKTKQGKEAEDLYYESFSKYQKAIEIKSDFYDAYDNLGIVLGYMAQSKQGKESEEIYKKAIETLKKAIELGGGSFNLSCIYAIKGERENAFFYLKHCLSKNEISVVRVEKDPEFKEILATYRTRT